MHLSETSPYPWPWDGALRGDRTALVVCGAQHAWAGTPGANGTLAAIEETAARLRTLDVLVVWTRHALPPGMRACPGRAPAPQTEPWALVVEPEPDDVIVDAAGIDGFYGSDLEAQLRGRRRELLVFAGFPRETTVDSTMRDANDRGFECLVARDLTAALSDSTGAAADASCTMSGGIFGTVGTAADLLDTFARVNATEEP